MSKFLSQKYKDILPYTPGEQPQNKQYIKLNTNENPFPPSPLAINAITKDALQSLRLYSDPQATQSTQAIADYYNLDFENVLVTNGSDEALAFVYMAFCDQQQEIVASDISYGFYPVFCQLLDLKYNKIALKDDFSIDVDSFCGINKNIIIANPNAPTGMAISVQQVEKIAQANPNNVVIIDEAYMDFGNQSSVCLIGKCPNIIIVGTFSKSRSLAGARLGYILASNQLIEDIRKIKYSFNPYNVNRITDLMGKYAFEDKEYFQKCVDKVIENREFISYELIQLGFEVLPSQANFIFARKARLDGENLYQQLKENGILVRHFGQERIKDFVRISIGTRKEMEILVKTIFNILQKENLL